MQFQFFSFFCFFFEKNYSKRKMVMLKVLASTLLFFLVIIHGMDDNRLLKNYADNKVGAIQHEYDGYKDVFNGNLHGAASQFAQRDKDNYAATTGGMFNTAFDGGKTVNDYGKMQNYNYQANVDLLTGHPEKAFSDMTNALNYEIKVEEDQLNALGECCGSCFGFFFGK
jgi:hypothetical protein